MNTFKYSSGAISVSLNEKCVAWPGWLTWSKRQRDKSLSMQLKHWQLTLSLFYWSEVRKRERRRGDGTERQRETEEDRERQREREGLLSWCGVAQQTSCSSFLSDHSVCYGLWVRSEVKMSSWCGGLLYVWARCKRWRVQKDSCFHFVHKNTRVPRRSVEFRNTRGKRRWRKL